MILDDFLDALEKCPDDELYDRFNIGENYTILLKADYRRVKSDLDASGTWEFNPRATANMGSLAELGEYRLYEDISKVVTLQVLSWVVPCFGASALEDHIREGGYTMSFMMVHDVLERGTLPEGVSSSRFFANAVKELILYAKKNMVPVCFPNSSLAGNQDEFISYTP